MLVDNNVEKKLASLQAWVVAGLAFMFVAAISFLVIAILMVENTAGKVAEEKHQGDQALACYIQPQFERSKATLPTLQYYKDHPAELADTLKSIDQQQQQAIDAWGVCES